MRMIAALATLAALVVSPALAASDVYIGVSAPLTGDNAEYGNYFKTAALLAQKTINDRGGIKGQKLQLLIEDSKADPKEAILIAQKFVSDPRVLAVVGDFNSSASMAAAEIYNDGGLVQISPTASHPDFTKKGEYIFRAGTTQSMEGAFLARWAVRDLGHKKIGTIYVNNDWGLVANKVFAETAKQLGADVVNQESFIPGDKDFTAIVTKIMDAKPDMVFLAVQWADAALIATQMKSLGLKTDLMGPGSLSTENLVKNAGDAVEGIRANAIYFAGDTRSVSADYTKAYAATYGRPPHDHSALTYDAVMLLANAIERGGVDRKAIRDALAATDGFEGVTGKFRFDADRNPVKDFSKIMVKNGKWQMADK
ncbi:MAG: ABC transporter substrate-binding protein [Ancalomicrobiaceae bacterium]|nr:ABC transporter substrate-binding protein [Ancalomicrobiaceae bacterium]